MPRAPFICNWCLNTGLVVESKGFYSLAEEKYYPNAYHRIHRCLHCNANFFDKRTAIDIYSDLSSEMIKELIEKSRWK